MKKGILLLFVVLMGFTSCGKKFGHRYLDGMWQMQRIEFTASLPKYHNEKFMKMNYLSNGC